MLVEFETAVQSAMATARLALGRGIVDETHERISWKMEKEPIACRNMAYYICKSLRLASRRMIKTYEVASTGVVVGGRDDLTDDRNSCASDDVPAALVSPSTVPRVANGEDTGHEVGRGREQEGLDFAEAEGLDDRGEEVCRVSVLANLPSNMASVDVQVKLMLRTAPVWMRTSNQVLGSLRACLRPTKTDSVTSSSWLSFSRARRYWASVDSTSDRKGVLLG